MVDSNAEFRYASSIFVTRNSMVREMYKHVDSFDRGSDLVSGVYDTETQSFNYYYQEDVLARDMTLAAASAVIVLGAMMVHTKSPFLTLIGLLQIVLSFPVAYFVYSLVLRQSFFPFLSFVGIFVVFALGADDVFVAVDKWKNARIRFPKAKTDTIAAIVLPDAAKAMFLTTLTTSVAFFATAIGPVAPIKLFAIFCGMLVMIDYLLCILFIFPALCIYDHRKMSTKDGTVSWYFEMNMCSRSGVESSPLASNQHGMSFIHRVLTRYYKFLHVHRWFFVVVSLCSISASIAAAKSMELPDSLDVRLLGEKEHFEKNFLWRKELFSHEIAESVGGTSYVFWGLEPADTGDHSDPETFSQLVLDKSFNPTSASTQVFLLEFCEALFDQPFARRRQEDYLCPMQSFDAWLQEQDNSTSPNSGYDEHCDGQTMLPIEPESFHPCMQVWANETNQRRVFFRDGRLQIMYVYFKVRVTYQSQFHILRDEFNLIDEWMNNEFEGAPRGSRTAFWVGGDFWWYDSHRAMQKTALGSGLIALGASTAVVLFSSRSLALAMFAATTILYVLASVTAIMAAMGWTLGFMESICKFHRTLRISSHTTYPIVLIIASDVGFAILVGISADFVTHFAHAYSTTSGDADRHARTKRAIIHMGPSILAAAFTTAAGAIVMLFTTIVFFQKFALVLFFSIIQATTGAFVFFCSIVDSVGPNNPTAFFQSIANRWSLKNGSTRDANENACRGQ